jgi:putative membrane protein
MGNWGAGGWIAMALMMVVFWGLVIGGIVWLVRSLSDRGPGRHREPSALELLDRRLAMGELSVQEYEERRRILAKGDGGRS